MSTDNEYGLVELTGRTFLCQPIFIDNDTNVLSAYGSTIRKISSKTGELLGSFRGHDHKVLTIKSIGKDVVLTASDDGKIILWNHVTMDEIRSMTLDGPVYDILIPRATQQKSQFLHSTDADIATTVKSSDAKSYLNEELYIVVGTAGQSISNCTIKLIAYDVSKNKIRRKVCKSYYAGNSTPASMAVRMTIDEHDNGYDWIVAVANAHHSEKKKLSEQSQLILWSTETKSGYSIGVDQGHVTCITSNDESDIIVTGHDSGEIVIWHQFKQWARKHQHHKLSSSHHNDDHHSAKKAHMHDHIISSTSYMMTDSPVRTRLHWHAHPVSCISIAADGRCIYSGGEEGVLVKWYVGADSNDRKAFIPRLGGAVCHISSSETQSKAVICLKDNSVRIIDFASLKVEWTVRSLSLGDTSAALKHHPDIDNSKANIKLLTEPRTGCIVCNSFPDSLQVLEPENLRIRNPYKILDHVRVSSTNIIKYDPMIIHVSYDDSYHHHSNNVPYLMLTVDRRYGEGLDDEYSIKFWSWNKSMNEYRLEAQMNNPHLSHHITCISYYRENPYHHHLKPSSSSSRRFITAGDDGSIKIWTRSINMLPTANVIDAKCVWTCAYSFKHRSSSVTAMACAYDGSVLAVAQDNIVYLWDPLRVVLKTSISFNQAAAMNSDPINYIGFVEPYAERELGLGNGEAMIVVGSSSTIAVYDLLTLKLLWSKTGKFTAISSALNGYQIVRHDKSQIWLAIASETIDDGHITRNVDFVDVRSGAIISSVSVKATVTSITFRSRSAMNMHGVVHIADGIFASTVEGDVIFYGRVVDDDEMKMKASNSNPQLAKISRGHVLPSIPYDTDMNHPSAMTSSMTPPATSNGPMSSMIANKKELEELFDSSTSNIPAVSSLLDSFLKASSHGTQRYAIASMMDPLPVPMDMVSSDDMSSKAASGEANRANIMRVARNPIISSEVQTIFSNTLAQLFIPPSIDHNVVSQPNATSTTTSATATTKSSSKASNPPVVKTAAAKQKPPFRAGGASAALKAAESKKRGNDTDTDCSVSSRVTRSRTTTSSR